LKRTFPFIAHQSFSFPRATLRRGTSVLCELEQQLALPPKAQIDAPTVTLKSADLDMRADFSEIFVIGHRFPFFSPFSFSSAMTRVVILSGAPRRIYP
jgi:hypothetical protein